MASVADEAVSAGKGIGQYFSIVAMVPALAAVGWITVLLAMGAWSGPFDPQRGLAAASGVSLGTTAILVATALVVGVVINPFQFVVTQWLEGYWGGDRLSLQIATNRINAHRRRLRDLDKVALEAERAFITGAQIDPLELADLSHSERVARAEVELAGETGDALIELDQVAKSALRARQEYPAPGRVMPTRLGNALRAFEDKAGSQYGLDAVLTAPRLGLLGTTERSSYVRDTRQSMDLAIRIAMMALLITPLTGLLLANDGAWVLLSLFPYLVGYFGYRGAIASAQAYGNAVRFQIDLDRFELYRALHLSIPSSAEAERRQNARLRRQLMGEEVSMTYETSQTGPN